MHHYPEHNRTQPPPSPLVVSDKLTNTQCFITDNNYADLPALQLTTEYNVRERGSPISQPTHAIPQQQHRPSDHPPNDASPVPPEVPVQNTDTSETPQQPYQQQQSQQDPSSSHDPNLPDPSTLPPVRASASSPHIDPTEPGIEQSSGLPIFEVDMENFTEKNWRRPGSDVSDWFNYGFDEISWEAYCVRRRDMSEMAAEMKANVLVRS